MDQRALIRLSPLQCLMEDSRQAERLHVLRQILGHRYYQQGVITFSPLPLSAPLLTFVSLSPLMS